MSDKPTIRIEIEDALKIRTPEMLVKVEKELDFMHVTDGLDGKPNLDNFHKIWKKRQGETGNKNDINSWTAVALGMTTKEPDGEFLPMRRAFARAGFPDIDTDFDDERRGEIYEYIINKYGRENVGNCGTYIAQKMKKSVKDVVRAVDAAYAFHKGDEECTTQNFRLANEISETLPVLPTGVIRWKDENGKEIIIKNLKKAYQLIPEFRQYMQKYPEVLKHAVAMEGNAGSSGCLTGDTPVLTNNGWVRIDQVDAICQKLAYINNKKDISFTQRFIVQDTGVKQVYRLELENGCFINVTDEHLIFTNLRCITFGEIRKNPDQYEVLSTK